MPFRPGLTLAALLTAACAPGGTSRLILAPQAVTGPVQGQGACMPDRPCELTGTVTLERRSGENS